MKYLFAALLASVFIACGGANPYDFALKGPDDKTYSLKDFAGKKLLIYFGYRLCADICPASLSLASEVLEELDAKNVKMIFITLDPDRDSAQDSSKYVQTFWPDSIGLQPSKEELERLAKVYGVKYEYVKQNSAADYTVAHSSSFYLIDENGKFHSELSNLAKSNLIKKIKKFLFN